MPCWLAQADLRDPDAIDRLFEDLGGDSPRLDLLINSAASFESKPFAEITAAEYARVTEVTYLGVVHGTMAALSRMRSRDRGVIGSRLVIDDIVHTVVGVMPPGFRA